MRGYLCCIVLLYAFVHKLHKPAEQENESIRRAFASSVSR